MDEQELRRLFGDVQDQNPIFPGGGGWYPQMAMTPQQHSGMQNAYGGALSQQSVLQMVGIGLGGGLCQSRQPPAALPPEYGYTPAFGAAEAEKPKPTQCAQPAVARFYERPAPKGFFSRVSRGVFKVGFKIGEELMLHALLVAIIAFFTALATAPANSAPAAPSWQRQSGESCPAYAERITGEFWSEHWCGDGPCYSTFKCGSGQCKSAAGFELHPYWKNQEHGCCVGQERSAAPNSIGWRCKWEGE